MKLEEVLPELRKGKKIRRKSWGKFDYIQSVGYKFFWACLFNGLYADDILFEDWEVME